MAGFTTTDSMKGNAMLTTSRYPFNTGNVNFAPESAGVYGLYDAAGNPIYFGRAQGGGTSIRGRLKDHLAGHEGKCTQGAASFAWEACSDPVRREQEILTQHAKLYGRLPKCNDRVG